MNMGKDPLNFRNKAVKTAVTPCQRYVHYFPLTYKYKNTVYSF